eukprot:836231-Pyramimonas_sp.AAC.1
MDSVTVRSAVASTAAPCLVGEAALSCERPRSPAAGHAPPLLPMGCCRRLPGDSREIPFWL